MANVICYILFAIGLILIIKGGDMFVDAASEISLMFGIPKFIIGATIVSLATTLPELLVSSIATLSGSTDMAIGNAIGSVTVNTGLILAIGIVFIPSVISRRQYMPKAVILITAITFLTVFSLSGRLTVFGSIGMLIIFFVFIYDNLNCAKEISGSSEKSSETRDKKKIRKNIILFIVSAALIVIGSDFLVDNGIIIAERFGVSQRIISITFVAIGTSLPELVTTISAIVKKQASLSSGNIIGANIIDTTLILPVCSFLGGGTLPVKAESIRVDMPACLIITLAMLIPSLITKKFSRLQGIVGILLYGIYIVISIFYVR